MNFHPPPTCTSCCNCCKHAAQIGGLKKSVCVLTLFLTPSWDIYTVCIVIRVRTHPENIGNSKTHQALVRQSISTLVSARVSDSHLIPSFL